ncbi:MAG: deoxyguanosinetriphosphate triphosphohydrolase [bacterium]|nr:deoxyguanosinetriphosphate triphosphohydrolase [bacterium]
MNIRQRIEQLEKNTLSPGACLSVCSRGRERFEEECEIRTAFQRDRDRIIHSEAFRRLKHKTQVFLSPESDLYRTRLTHTLEVSQIARTISRALCLNEDLTEAISLAHDLGHTPFGHEGERALNSICGNFNHYEQGVRVCTIIEKNGQGLNLTKEVLDGVLHHTKGDLPFTLEGCVVRISDRIAYINHDIDDAIMAGVLRQENIPSDILRILGGSKSQRIDAMVTSVIENSHDTIKMDEKTQAVFDRLHRFLFENVYHNEIFKEEEKKVLRIISGLYRFYIKNPESLPDSLKPLSQVQGVERTIIDHIASMTDRCAVQTYKNIYIPDFWDE